jgi:hypothetical protein
MDAFAYLSYLLTSSSGGAGEGTDAVLRSYKLTVHIDDPETNLLFLPPTDLVIDRENILIISGGNI